MYGCEVVCRCVNPNEHVSAIVIGPSTAAQWISITCDADGKGFVTEKVRHSSCGICRAHSSQEASQRPQSRFDCVLAAVGAVGIAGHTVWKVRVSVRGVASGGGRGGGGYWDILTHRLSISLGMNRCRLRRSAFLWGFRGVCSLYSTGRVVTPPNPCILLRLKKGAFQTSAVGGGCPPYKGI